MEPGTGRQAELGRLTDNLTDRSGVASRLWIDRSDKWRQSN